MEAAPRQRKTWPWILIAIGLTAILALIPPVLARVLAADVSCARWFNGFVHRSRSFDLFLIRTNTRRADLAVFFVIGMGMLVYAFLSRRKEKMTSTLAFWAWVGILFTVLCFVLEALEKIMQRPSPGLVLANWRDLSEFYVTTVKVKAIGCFPSDHATAWFFLGFMAVRRYRRLGIFLLAFALALSPFRVIIGSHWMSDALFGAVPLTALMAALAFETPLIRLRDVCEHWITRMFAWFKRRPADSTREFLTAQQLVRLLLVIGLLRLVSFQACPLIDETEGRYALISSLMVKTGNWVVPRMAFDTPFWGKPPLAFWIGAAIFKVFGIGEFTARLGSFLPSVVAVLLVVMVGRRLYNLSVGLVAGAILASAALFHVLAGFVMTDPCLTATITLTMVSLPMAATSHDRRRELFWGYAFFAGLGLSLLAKGPVAIVFAVLALGGWAAIVRPWKILRALPWISGLALTLAISVPWHILAERQTPGFLHYYFVDEHWKRFLVPGWKSLYGKAHQQPMGFVWVGLIAGGLPWFVLLAVAAWKGRRDWKNKCRESPWSAYFACWMLAPFIIFTPSPNAILTYALPAIPAMAILTALLLAKPARDGSGTREVCCLPPGVFRLLALFVPVVLAAGAFVVGPSLGLDRSQKDLIRTFQKKSKSNRAELVYTEDLPYSAAFYGGEIPSQVVTDIKHKRPTQIRSDIAHGGEVYLAIRKTKTADFRDEVGIPARKLGEIGDYILCRAETTSETLEKYSKIKEARKTKVIPIQ